MSICNYEFQLTFSVQENETNQEAFERTLKEYGTLPKEAIASLFNNPCNWRPSALEIEDLTREQEIANRDKACPYCGYDGNELEYDDIEYDDDHWQDVTCPECGKKWRDVYLYSGRETVE